MCRKNILNGEQYYISSFILGVWNYIVCNVTDNENDECKASIGYLLSPKGEARVGRKVNCNIGISRSSEVNLAFDLPYSESVDADDKELSLTYHAAKAHVILGADVWLSIWQTFLMKISILWIGFSLRIML